ncbi:adenylosuccinate synthase [bacterium]|nr:adenylosuccinate synthase [bacterium]
MMLTVVLGLQWGDEGKGKIIDYLTKNNDVVVRFQGGDNAGHTIKVKDKEIVNHLVPSGIFYKNVKCVIGNGLVVNMHNLIDEIKSLGKMGLNIKDIYISNKAHIICDIHKRIDALSERKGQTIGTTKRGIGPAYGYKHLRTGLRFSDFEDEKYFEKRLKALIKEANIYLEKFGEKQINFKKTKEILISDHKKLEPYICSTEYLINKELRKGKNILFEGSQGTFLDIDFGTYPYVTSSNTTIGGVITGTGISPKAISNIIGISKAYATRVGQGPFPTEISGVIGKELRNAGNEFGATTGRPRRVGWLDLFALNYSIMINGIDEIALTKLDVLSDFDKIKICTGYRLNGKKLKYFPSNIENLKKSVPIYKNFKGWKKNIDKTKKYDDLPLEAKRYIEFIEQFTNIKVGIISYGKNRRDTIER